MGKKRSFEELARLGPDDEFLKALQSKSASALKRAVRFKASDGRSFTVSCIFSGIRMRAALAAGADPFFADNKGQAPIHWAARLGAADALSALIEVGASVSAPVTENRLTPIHLAAASLSPAKIKLLLDAGACLDVTDSKGYTPLEMARSFYEDRMYSSSDSKTKNERMAEALAALELLEYATDLTSASLVKTSRMSL